MKCAICGFARYVENCHIIPRRLGGSRSKDNFIHLCPNHHKLLDNGLLNNEEEAIIDHRIVSLTNQPKIMKDMKKLEYLYFLIGLRGKPKWLGTKKRVEPYF